MKSEYNFTKAKKVKKPMKELKVLKTFRLDPEVLEWLETEGEKNGMGYQTYLNWFLKKAMDDNEIIEDRVSKLEQMLMKKKA